MFSSYFVLSLFQNHRRLCRQGCLLRLHLDNWRYCDVKACTSLTSFWRHLRTFGNLTQCLLFHVAYHPLVDRVLLNCNFWDFKEFGPACGISPVCGTGLFVRLSHESHKLDQSHTGPSCSTNWAKLFHKLGQSHKLGQVVPQTGPISQNGLNLVQFVGRAQFVSPTYIRRYFIPISSEN